MSFVPKLLASLGPRGKYQKILHGTLLCLKRGSLHLGHSACTLYSSEENSHLHKHKIPVQELGRA